MDWCDQVGIAYIEKNLEDPQTNLEAVRDYGEIEIVPTSIVNGDVIVGFNRRAIKKALRLDTGEADEEDES